MDKPLKAALLLPLLLGFGEALSQSDDSNGPALDAESKADPASETATNEPVDELTVIGPKSRTVLRRELRAAENAAYSMFNELNDDDRYDIVCKRETRIGSQIPYRVCLPRIHRETLTEMTEDEGSGFGLSTGAHIRALRERMAAIANQNPDFHAALVKRLEIKKELEAARERRPGE